MKSWSFSLALLLEYLLTFQLWRTFPNRSAYLVVGGLFCVPGDASIFHNNFNFCGCAAVFGVLIGGYHGWALRKARTTGKSSPVSTGPRDP
jgi:hypothetical protein